ncbi:GNAT family N-acetyltransferase (plasmid) [Burkholderia sp. M6-3]
MMRPNASMPSPLGGNSRPPVMTHHNTSLPPLPASHYRHPGRQEAAVIPDSLRPGKLSTQAIYSRPTSYSDIPYSSSPSTLSLDHSSQSSMSSPASTVSSLDSGKPTPPTQRPTRLAEFAQAPMNQVGSHGVASTSVAAASQQPKTETREIRDEFKFSREIANMKQQLTGMYKTKKGFMSRLSGADKAHNTRIDQCLTVLDKHMGGNRNFIIHIDGQPAGMMSLSVPPDGTLGDSGVKIHGLMSLPGTKGVGRRAIEQAVQVSIHEGRGGRLDLEFLEFSNSHDVYRSFGFVRNGDWDSNSMYLSGDDAQKFLKNSAGKSPVFLSAQGRPLRGD